ncbi:hypothetical protein KI387_015084, partial [Taxus chinensis]
ERASLQKCADADRLGTERMNYDSEEDSDYLKLTLSPPGQSSVYSKDSASTQGGGEWCAAQANSGSSNETAAPVARRARRGGGGGATGGPSRPKEECIVPAYTWATDRRAVVHSLDYLLGHGIHSIRGDLVCKRCDGKEAREVDLQSSLVPLSSSFLSRKDTLHDRAPKVWMVPRLLDCNLCHQSDCVKPVIDEKKRRINWLFLLLTQTLGLCTLDQLKYFCKHTKKHRTGAKDRVLYLTYVGLLKQLNPSGPYE